MHWLMDTLAGLALAAVFVAPILKSLGVMR
jgi:hypothetical protein